MIVFRWLLVLLLLCSAPAARAADEDMVEGDFVREANVDVLNGNFDRAIRVYQRMQKKFPRSPLSYFGMGKVYFMQFKWQEASECFITATTVDPRFANGYFYLGKTYWNWRKPAEGIAAFEKYLEVEPTSGYAGKVQTWIKTLKSVGKDIDWNI